MLKDPMGRFLNCIFLVGLCLLGACATAADKRLTLKNALEDNIAISIPMRMTEKGLVVLESIKIDGHSLDMVLDTGATRSAIFQTALDRLNLNISSESTTMVHGIIQSRSRHVVKIPKLEIGPLAHVNKPIVVLDDREQDLRKTDIYDGLIGMDILSDYQIYVSATKKKLRFIPNKTPIDVPFIWPRIFLKGNPYQSDERSLHFMDIRVAGQKTPALLDTGAEFSLMNWSAADYSQVRHIRKRLRNEWELQGAVGVFRPTTTIKLQNIRGGQVFWDDKNFIVMSLDSLDILGIEDKPFIIAGMNLFEGDSIFIDFGRDFISIIPEGFDQLDGNEG